MGGQTGARLPEELAGVEEGLGRDAADAQAGAAERCLPVHADHAHAELGGPDGGHVAARARADDCEVVALRLGHGAHTSRSIRTGILEALLDSDQEGHGLRAVYQTVIIGQCDVHHGADHDLTVHRHRPVLDLVHPENPGLRRVEDRGREQRAEDAAVGDGEGAAGEIVRRDLAVASPPGQFLDPALQVGQAERVRAPDHRHHEPALGAHRDAEMHLAMVDDVGAVDLGVDHGHIAERPDAGAAEQGHQPQIHAVPVAERFAVAPAGGQEGREIHLVERGEDGRGPLRLHEPLGDPAA